MVIVTSQTAAKILFSDLEAVEKIKKTSIIVIGDKTGTIFKSASIEVLKPSKFDSETLYNEFKDFVKGKRVAILRSDKGSPVLLQFGNVAEVKEFKIYNILEDEENAGKIPEILLKGNVGSVIFTSSFIVRTFMKSILTHPKKQKLLKKLQKMNVIAIGPPTKKSLEKYGIKARMPDNYTFEAAVFLLKSCNEKLE